MANLPIDAGAIVKDAVQLIVDNRVYDGWQSMSVGRSMQALSATFALEIQDKWRQLPPGENDWVLKPSDAVKINFGKTTAITGFIDDLEVSVDPASRSLTISGRDKTADLVDCSPADGVKNEFKKQTFLQIAKALTADFGIDVVVSGTGASQAANEIIPKFKLSPGSTVFDELLKVAKMKGLLMLTSATGRLIIAQAAKTSRFFSQIEVGKNLKAGTATYSDANRYSKYTVIGQKAGDDDSFGKNASQPLASATDGGITRFRPLTIVANHSISIKDAQDRANWESATRVAGNARLSVTVQNWRDQTGRIWDINNLIKVKLPILGLTDELLIEGVQYTLDQTAGKLTTLTLVRPDAYTPEPAKTKAQDKKDDLGWGS